MNAQMKLIIQRLSQTMSKDGPAAVIGILRDKEKLAKHTADAKHFVEDAILVVKSARDYPGWSDEEICQRILDNYAQRHKD